MVAPLPFDRRIRSHNQSRSHPTRLLSRRRGSQSQVVTGTSYPILAVSNAKKVTVKPDLKPIFEKEVLIRWLASEPDKFKSLPQDHQPMPAHLSRRPKICHSTVESQRIGHFLSSLPEELSGYESASGAYSMQTFKTPRPSNRSELLPSFDQQNIKRSHSQEELLTPSHLLAEESDNDQFSGITNSKLIHYASDSALNLAPAMSKQTLRETTADLKAFAATTSSTKFSCDSTNLTPKKGSAGCSKDSSIDPKAMAGSSSEQSVGTSEILARDVPSVRPQSSELPKLAVSREISGKYSRKNLFERRSQKT